MNWLIAGVALFISTHLVSAVVPSAVSSLKAAIGPNLFRGIYSVLVLVGVTLIVIGWRSAIPVVVYAPPVWGSHLALTLMFVAVYLFGASHAKLRVLRFVRHPSIDRGTDLVSFAPARERRHSVDHPVRSAGNLGGPRNPADQSARGRMAETRAGIHKE